jgi:hypothetical protein
MAACANSAYPITGERTIPQAKKEAIPEGLYHLDQGCEARWLALVRTFITLLSLPPNASKLWWIIIRVVVDYTGNEVIPFAANLHGLPVSHLWTAQE